MYVTVQQLCVCVCVCVCYWATRVSKWINAQQKTQKCIWDLHVNDSKIFFCNAHKYFSTFFFTVYNFKNQKGSQKYFWCTHKYFIYTHIYIYMYSWNLQIYVFKRLCMLSKSYMFVVTFIVNFTAFVCGSFEIPLTQTDSPHVSLCLVQLLTLAGYSLWRMFHANVGQITWHAVRQQYKETSLRKLFL